jgi:hypothetical protein
MPIIPLLLLLLLLPSFSADPHTVHHPHLNLHH